MSISYSISIILNLKYEKNNIEYLFQQCLENNMCFYADPFDKLSKLDSSGATTRMLTVELEDEERNVYAKFQDTDFSIWVYKRKNNLINFFIGNFGIRWKKEFIHGGYGIDFARYIRLLLRVCRNFTILELKTSAF